MSLQENYTAKTYTVIAELEEVTNIMDALKAQTKCIQALVEETQSESAVMKQELSKAKKSVSCAIGGLLVAESVRADWSRE